MTFSFDDPHRGITLNHPNLPRPWINYLGNAGLRAFISQQGGGLLWLLEPYTRRISRYHYTAAPGDQPGFYVYVLDHDSGALWNPHFAPTCYALDAYRCVHHPGVTSIMGEVNGIRVTVDYTIPPDDDVMIWRIRAENTGHAPRSITLASYLEFGLLEFMREAVGWCYLKNQLGVTFDPDSGFLRYDYHVFEAPATPRMVMTCTRPVSGWDCSRDAFVGTGTGLSAPQTLLSQKGLSNSQLPDGGHGCGVLGVNCSLAPNDIQEVSYLFAAGDSWPEAEQRAGRYRDTASVSTAFETTEAYWAQRFRQFQIESPSPEMDRFINTWTPLNCMTTLQCARTISTDHMGTDGLRFRDTSQDALAVAHLDPEFAVARMKQVLEQQTPDGGGCFAFFPHTSRPTSDTPHRSDNPVWPVYTITALIAETGDWSLLDKHVPYRNSRATGSVYDHLLLGLKHIAERRGPHGLPYLYHADWNDSLALFGDEKAESVMLGQQLAHACKKLIPLARHQGDADAETWCVELSEKLDRALNSGDVWDGKWYRRLLLSDGRVIGSSNNAQGQIYLNTQSWAVLSETDQHHERGRNAMDEAACRLDTEYGLRVLTPAFRGFPEPDDPPLGSNPGIGENGGIFCHANTWAIIAECLLGNADRAYKYYHQLLPESIIRRIGLEQYQREPYTYVSSIVGPDAKTPGQGGISWLTGTASWMYIAATQYLLGIRPTLEGLVVSPCLPASFEEVTVTRHYRGAAFRIRIRNARRATASLTVDGQAVEGLLVPAFADGEHEVICEC